MLFFPGSSEVLCQVVRLLAYISDKDLFAEFYRSVLHRKPRQKAQAPASFLGVFTQLICPFG